MWQATIIVLKLSLLFIIICVCDWIFLLSSLSGENPPGQRSASPPVQLCLLSVSLLGPAGVGVHRSRDAAVQLACRVQRPSVHGGLRQRQGNNSTASKFLRYTGFKTFFTIRFYSLLHFNINTAKSMYSCHF